MYIYITITSNFDHILIPSEIGGYQIQGIFSNSNNLSYFWVAGSTKLAPAPQATATVEEFGLQCLTRLGGFPSSAEGQFCKLGKKTW